MATDQQQFSIPENALVVLIGASAAGKSTFARQHFLPTEVISSDFCRALITDDENALDANIDTFDLLNQIVAKRLARGRLTVVDATNVQPEARKPLVQLARDHYVTPVALVLNPSLRLLEDRSAARLDRQLPAHVLRNQQRALRASLKALRREGFKLVYEWKDPAELERVVLTRTRLRQNRRDDNGPFDIIGDVHGCFQELRRLLEKLGYQVISTADRGQHYGYQVIPPEGRRAIFLGDLVDRGPASNEVLRLVMSMVEAGSAYCLLGNHDAKLGKKLQGKAVQISHGLAQTLEQLATEDDSFVTAVRNFLYDLTNHYVFDEGRLVVAHAGLREDMQGRAGASVHAFCLYGDTSGETDEFGLPVRYPWATDYRGAATVVYGHTPVPSPEWLNRTLCIDTGCVFGGQLTALRYPERELVSVAAERVYVEPRRPARAEEVPAPAGPADDLPDIQSLLGRQTITTRLHGHLSISEAQTTAALETMSRFAIDPRRLIYLPPTMSPVETSELEGFLEHPTQAFDYYRRLGVRQVICEEKHMGSRAIVVVGREEDSLQSRFGLAEPTYGWIFTRTGRPFFADAEQEAALLDRLRAAIRRAGTWDNLATDWLLLDAELMPWSAKARKLLEEQYAAVATAGELGLATALAAAERADGRGLDSAAMVAQLQSRLRNVQHFREAYRQYCWPADSVEDLKLAPFHLLAGEGKVYVEQDHGWHLRQIAAICAQDPTVLLMTDHRLVDLEDPTTEQAATDWWLGLTAGGGEGMVVKPLSFIARGQRGLLQPALKVRGPGYLRIIYGPDYLEPANLQRLRRRAVGRKRSLAIREFALGVEALERFVNREPLPNVHACVFGILALESEPVDPAL